MVGAKKKKNVMHYKILEQDTKSTTVLIDEIEVEIWDIELRQYVTDEDIPFYPDFETHQDFIDEFLKENRDELINRYMEANYDTGSN